MRVIIASKLKDCKELSDVGSSWETRQYVGTQRRNPEQNQVRRLALFVPPRLATPCVDENGDGFS